ncbi:MAG: alpha/beta hydrolase-fold protein [Saprospiraceae bacterium]|nr:alpha/beta hydrolase [Lewinella sp.]
MAKSGQQPESSFVFGLETGAEQDERLIGVSGNFNDWDTADPRYVMTMIRPGYYELQLPADHPLPGVLEYKYHRGSWAEVELDRYGNESSNRRVEIARGRITDRVDRWKNAGKIFHPEFLPNIQVISETFEIPQLIKTRRIAALLPYDYYQTDKRYPVLYLQDGQNLFDDYAPFGSWGVDKKLAVMAERGTHEVIIIAIDHAEEERIEEFTPSYRTRLGVGQGKKYVSFLADTLKPYIDNHFRTLPGRENTGIGGSSMGGLISIYAGFMYPEVYSKLMIFSPSLWVAPNIHFHAIHFKESAHTKVYLYGGGAEGANVVPNIQRLKLALEAKGQGVNTEFALAIDPQGEHNEQRWGEEFPRAVEWLFFNRST